ncbi:MAG: ribbon-helix-helix domain-containing protein [Candidatus Accumulibacter sp.]|uniref:ribbon-helix-helix domain-containing protein n=1 Tax=Accumulibacter sp. TaxID=2053492 RepID=UPI00258C5FA8|nr:ribbon-helix-helix domain-containing protein [Accumulibacter sp.]MBK8116041.1 ribbon-helix-helix domain-containing protein [Accumulibacter sp.]
MSNEETTRLTVTLSRETDLALRAFLGAQGMRKGDLSKFIEDAVRWRMFDQAVQGVKARNADMDADDLQAAIDEACATVRSEMWPTYSKAL